MTRHETENGGNVVALDRWESGIDRHNHAESRIRVVVAHRVHGHVIVTRVPFEDE